MGVLSFSKLFNVIFMIYTQVSEIHRQNEKTKFETLKNWGVENGAVLGKFEIKYLTANNRYVVASEHIRKNEIIVSIPHILIFNIDNPLINPFCKINELFDFKCLSAYMSVYYNQNSNFFNPFFKFLPNDFHSYLLFYPDYLKEKIKGSLLERTLKKWEKGMIEEFDYVNVRKYVF
jgi:hypothetical protein